MSMTKPETNAAAMLERVIMVGDLSKLTDAERLLYVKSVCESLGLNPLTRPFDYISLGGKLVLYAKKDATDQLRKLHKVSIDKMETEQRGDIYIVIAHAVDKDDRRDASLGAVNTASLKGDALANAMMKAETKAKRRVTLSICGLGILEETELDTVPNAKPVTVNPETGEVLSPAVAPPTPSGPEPSAAPVASVPSPAGDLLAYAQETLSKDALDRHIAKLGEPTANALARGMFKRPDVKERGVAALSQAERQELADELDGVATARATKK